MLSDHLQTPKALNHISPARPDNSPQERGVHIHTTYNTCLYIPAYKAEIPQPNHRTRNKTVAARSSNMPVTELAFFHTLSGVIDQEFRDFGADIGAVQDAWCDANLPSMPKGLEARGVASTSSLGGARPVLPLIPYSLPTYTLGCIHPSLLG